ncbi:hypothetical protein FISHEDRAFT_77947 [Fistulina hepatica ATCC 64428]|nr:hypothetical protein FISHEDRAFT_77947 [Fistulina hepatica ATCC 64428]
MLRTVSRAQMRRNIRFVFPSSCVGRTRCASYHSKVTAYPFDVTPEQALSKYIAPYAARLIKDQPISPSWLERLFEDTRLPEGVSRKTFVPFYWPTWQIIVSVATKMTYNFPLISGTTANIVMDKDAVNIYGAYLPGNGSNLLSCVPFPALGPEGIRKTVPWSDALRQQHGHDIFCMPYTIDAPSLCDLSRWQMEDELPLSSQLSIDLRSLNFNFLALYPIVLPMYMASYVHEATGKEIRLFLLAAQLSSLVGDPPLVWSRDAETSHHAKFGNAYFGSPSYQGDFAYQLRLGYSIWSTAISAFNALPRDLPDAAKELTSFLGQAFLDNAETFIASASVPEDGEVSMSAPFVRQAAASDSLASMQYILSLELLGRVQREKCVRVHCHINRFVH